MAQCYHTAVDVDNRWCKHCFVILPSINQADDEVVGGGGTGGELHSWVVLRKLAVTAVRLRIRHCGSLCRVVQDGWITGDVLTLQFGVPLWAHVTGRTNSPRISSSCLFHPDIQFSATRPHRSSRAAKRARGAKDKDRYYKHEEIKREIVKWGAKKHPSLLIS